MRSTIFRVTSHVCVLGNYILFLIDASPSQSRFPDVVMWFPPAMVSFLIPIGIAVVGLVLCVLVQCTIFSSSGIDVIESGAFALSKATTLPCASGLPGGFLGTVTCFGVFSLSLFFFVRFPMDMLVPLSFTVHPLVTNRTIFCPFSSRCKNLLNL